MPTQDEEIARHLREALASGELAGIALRLEALRINGTL